MPENKVLEAFRKNQERANEDAREKAAKDKKRKEEELKRKERVEAEKLAKQVRKQATPLFSSSASVVRTRSCP